MLPSERAVLPPSMAIFSRTITLAPRSTAVAAATMPAPPPPTMMTSACVSSGSALSEDLASAFFLKKDASAPACLSASLTALMMASEVIVAPLTTSTELVCWATIAAGSASTASEPMPGVSC